MLRVSIVTARALPVHYVCNVRDVEDLPRCSIGPLTSDRALLRIHDAVQIGFYKAHSKRDEYDDDTVCNLHTQS